MRLKSKAATTTTTARRTATKWNCKEEESRWKTAQTVWNRSQNDLMPLCGDLKEQQTVMIILITIDRIDRIDRLTHLLSGLRIRVALHEGHEEEKGTDGHGIVGGLLGYCLAKRWLDVGARPHDASQSYPTIYGGSHEEETEQTKSEKSKSKWFPISACSDHTLNLMSHLRHFIQS